MQKPRVNTPLTVAELIEKLQKLPQDLTLELEGCDCMGTCYGVGVQGYYEPSTWDKEGKFVPTAIELLRTSSMAEYPVEVLTGETVEIPVEQSQDLYWLDRD